MISEQFVPGLVSVIVPVYNRADLVTSTLESILGQSYGSIEVVAVNDGSTDGSLAVLQRYAAAHPGKVLVLDQENAGQVRARNNGLARARGEYLAFLDSDDTWEKEKLSLQLPLFRDGVGLVYCAIHEVDEAGGVLRTVPCDSEARGDAYRPLLIRNRMTGGAVVVSREALLKADIFDETLRAGENWDLWIRIAKHFRIDFVNQPLVRYLKHSGNMSQDSKRMQDASFRILQKHLPAKPRERALRRCYDLAYANYHYCKAVSEFSSGDYLAARQSFYACCRHRLLYRDSVLRILRTFLGERGNRFIHRLKTALAPA